MTLAQDRTAIIVFWAIIGGIGAGEVVIIAIVLPPAETQRVADVLEDDAQVLSNTALAELVADRPPAIRDEILRIDTDARPLALQVALLVPLLAALAGLFNAFRMMRLPDPVPAGSGEVAAFG